MAKNNPIASPEEERALSSPPWFGPHAILEAVDQLVVYNINNKIGSRACSWEQIRDYLLQTHRQQQQEEELPHDLFDSKVQAELEWLVQMGDLELETVNSTQYIPSPPYLPPWFRPEKVLEAVGELDKGNASGGGGGSTLDQIRDSLVRKHGQNQPLPVNAGGVLWAILALLLERDHLTIITGPQQITRRKALAPDEPNPIEIPGYLWCYHLGYLLGRSCGVSVRPDPKIRGKDTVMPNNLNAPRWFGPRTVLEEVQRLCLDDLNKATTAGWTVQEIRESLKRTHDDDLPSLDDGFDFDATLRATLNRLSNRGYLKATGLPSKKYGKKIRPRYTLSITPPCLPSWFHPEAVLQAVGKLDAAGSYSAGGSTTVDLVVYFEIKHGPRQLPGFDRVLRTTLSVLSLRGHLRSRRGPGGSEHYTRRDAPATTDIPDNDLLCYYVGYKLGLRRRGYGLDDDGAAESAKPGASDVRVLRERRKQANDDTETQPLLPQAGGKERKSGLFGWWRGIAAWARQFFKYLIRTNANGAHYDIEWPQPNDEQARTKDKRNQQQRELYMIWSMSVSFCGHALLLGLSFIHVLEEETSNKWLKWGVMNLLVPLVLLIAMIVIQRSFIDLEDTSSPDKEHVKALNWNKTVNLLVMSCSKIVYVVIKEAPGPNITLRIIAHVVDFLIDMGGAIYLCRNLSCLDLDLME